MRQFFRGGIISTLMAWSGASLAAAAAVAPAPQLSLSLRGVGDDVVEQGEPVRIALRLTSPRGGGGVELAPSSGSWIDAISVELVSAQDAAAAARAEAVGKPAMPHASLDPKRIAGGLWCISSAAMQRVAPGDYLVRARLSLRGGRGWNGEATSDEMPLQVVAPSASTYRVTQRVVNQAHEALLGGRVEQAAAMVDAVLQRTPDDVRLLLVRAAIAHQAGNPMATLICLNRAQRSSPPSGGGPPPLEPDELRVLATARLMKDQPSPANPPAWSWPPAAVLAAPLDEVPAGPKADAVASPAIRSPANPAEMLKPAAARTAEVISPTPPGRSSPGIIGPSPGVVVLTNELSEVKILTDSAGQWAVSAAAGTQYGKTQYSASQATGAPNITVSGNSPNAWCPAVRDKGNDWLEVTFAKPVSATEVRVRQTDAVGAVAKVEAIEPDGTAHVWWEGVDPYEQPAIRAIAWFGVRVPPTSYRVARIKLTLNLASGPGYKQIDAVQLVAVP